MALAANTTPAGTTGSLALFCLADLANSPTYISVSTSAVTKCSSNTSSLLLPVLPSRASSSLSKNTFNASRHRGSHYQAVLLPPILLFPSRHLLLTGDSRLSFCSILYWRKRPKRKPKVRRICQEAIRYFEQDDRHTKIESSSIATFKAGYAVPKSFVLAEAAKFLWQHID